MPRIGEGDMGTRFVKRADHVMRGNPDRLKIDIRDAWEVRWWCKQFGCTDTELRETVKVTGLLAAKVRKHLEATGHTREQPNADAAASYDKVSAEGEVTFKDPS